MKPIIVCVLLLSYLHLANGGWLDKILNKVCPIFCPKVCTFFDGPIGSVVCKLVCSLGCGRSKRHITQSSTRTGHVIPLANRFDAFDLNDDGHVSKQELGVAIADDVSNPDFNTAFRLADSNGDGNLTPRELYRGPFVFELDLSDNNVEYCESLLNATTLKTKG